MKEQLIEAIVKSKILSEWHWFVYQFQFLKFGLHTPFSEDFVDKIFCVETKIPGFAIETVKRMASICGREKYIPHYEQLLQLLVEVIIFARLAQEFQDSSISFEWEPTAGNTKTNPELKISGADWNALIEVKCPSLINHLQTAPDNDVQLAARLSPDPSVFKSFSKSGDVTMPLDNKVKDFLVSAEKKFYPFKETGTKSFSLLVIAWDDKMFEAVSPLINGMSGLLTENSFYRDAGNSPIVFPSVDEVLITEHLGSALRGTREEQLPIGFSTPLDYGNLTVPGFVPPVFLSNPSASDSDTNAMNKIIQALGGFPLSEASDPRVQPMDMVFWL